MPDLTSLPSDREVYKERLRQAYPSAKAGAIRVWAGQLFRFVHEVNIGDLVVYPSKVDKRIHIGRIKGEYHHVPSPGHDYANRRSVDWLNDFPRAAFTQGALCEIGSALSFFQVKNYADEYLAALEGRELEVSAGRGRNQPGLPVKTQFYTANLSFTDSFAVGCWPCLKDRVVRWVAA